MDMRIAVLDQLKRLAIRRDQGNAVGFDHTFYAKHYPDLRQLRTRAALYKHFQNHGKGEGRFPSLSALKESLAHQGHVLPDGFTWNLYRQLNPDLQRLLDEPWQYEVHFLQHGRAEGRLHRLRDGETFHSGWRSILNLYDFLLFSEEWRDPDVTSRQAVFDLFEREGIDRLTPIARDWAFDPAFYQQHYGLEPLPPAVLYRDWIERGFDEGRAPNETRAIQNLVGSSGYPAAFDWRSYVGGPVDAPIYPTKITALRDVFEAPFEQRASRGIKGPGTASLFAQIGDYHLIRGGFALAERCYSRALTDDRLVSSVHLHRGDALRANGRQAEALGSYKGAMALPSYSVWALVHHAKTTMSIGSVQACFDTLKNEHDRWAGDPFYRTVVDECIEMRFQQVSDATRKLVEGGDVEAAYAYADAQLPALTAEIKALKVPAPVTVTRDPKRVTMLACLDLPQCTHYRVKQKVEQLAALGIECDVFDFNDPVAFMSDLPGASAAIFYRVPAYPKIVEAILYAQALRVPTFYDIDDLIFTPDFPDDFESYEGQIDQTTFVGLRCGVPLYRHAISLCEVGIASTRPLADRLGPLVRRAIAHVHPNGLDLSNAVMVQVGERPRPSGDRVTIFYGSGTKAHNRDFNALVGPALFEILSTMPTVQLVVVGYLTLDDRFGSVEGQISRFPFVDDRSQYASLLASSDINISVLHAGAVADCKSEIKWLEAAILQVPTIVSRTETFEQVLNAPDDGLIADTTEDWLGHLKSLIQDPGRRRSIGAAARSKALRLYSVERIGLSLAATLAGALDDGRQIRPVARTTRVLLCNVFFAPQTHGGATRVVEDNLRSFVDHFPTEFDLSVFTTDHGMPVGSFKVDTYRGCTVYRVGTPLEVNMDWRPFNPDVGDTFTKVLALAKPDLVHFHCIQRLTASIVEEALRQGIPYVVTVHDAWWISDHQFLVDQQDALVDPGRDDFAAPLPKEVTRPQSLERRHRLRTLLNKARYTLPVSKSFGAIYEAAGITNVHPIPNGVGAFAEVLPSVTPPGTLVIGHLGGRSAHKGASLLEVVLRENAFANLSLIMIDGTIEFGHEVKATWGATAVSLRGVYPQVRINELFAAIDVLVAPSIWPESFGLIVREARHFGKWVVASDRGALAEDIVDGEDGTVIDVGGKRDLTDILRRMNDDPRSFKQVRPMSGRTRSSHQQALDLADLYRSILARRAVEVVSEAVMA